MEDEEAFAAGSASTSLARWAIGVGVIGAVLFGVGGLSSLVLAVASVLKRKPHQVSPWVALLIGVLAACWLMIVLVVMSQPTISGGGFVDNSSFALVLGAIAIVLGLVTLLLLPSW